MYRNPSFDVAIVGGGLAGISAALELLDHKLKIVIIDRDSEQNFGGLATKSLGGMALVNTPIQRLNRVHDSAEIALRDWLSFARFSEQDIWPKNGPKPMSTAAWTTSTIG
jgi:predicted oxidoreductase